MQLLLKFISTLLRNKKHPKYLKMSLTRRNFLKSTLFSAAALLLKGTGCQAKPAKEHNSSLYPSYKKLEAEGKLKERIELAYEKLRSCDLCPHRCGVDRSKGQKGFCNAPYRAVVHSYSPHYGEELPLVGNGGSGTIFFSNCNLRCVFCQNWPIAHEGRGRQVSDEELADMMIALQRRGCHNINVVTPTHVMPNILAALRIAIKKGLNIPLCYNTGGYELKENIELLDGIADIYLPDLKFMDGDKADKYIFTGSRDYPEMAQESIIEMHRQTEDLVTNDRDIAVRGLMVRHLVMPNRVSGTKEFVRWVAENLSKETYVNIMSQYRVEHRAFEYDKISRAITADEFIESIRWAKEAGLTNLDRRSVSRLEMFRRMFR